MTDANAFLAVRDHLRQLAREVLAGDPHARVTAEAALCGVRDERAMPVAGDVYTEAEAARYRKLLADRDGLVEINRAQAARIKDLESAAVSAQSRPEAAPKIEWVPDPEGEPGTLDAELPFALLGISPPDDDDPRWTWFVQFERLIEGSAADQEQARAAAERAVALGIAAKGGT